MAVCDSDPADVSSPLVPVLGARRDGLTLRLVRADGAVGGPFVVLHEGRFARVYLAEVVADGRAPVARFAWKIRADDERTRAAAGGRRLLNGELEAMWGRERAELSRVQSPNVAAPFAAPAALCASPPVAYCQRVDRYFHPASPRSGDVLRTCRDDGVLLAAGLASHAADDARYLHDGGGATGVFYRSGEAVGGEHPRSGVAVRTAPQLIRDWTALVHGDPREAAVGRAAAVLPCVTCPHRGECYPASDAVVPGPIPAERELHFVSFHDVEGIAVELHHFDYHEATALLGGGDLLEVLGPRITSGRAAAVEPAAVAALTSPQQWLFAQDPGRLPLEVLRQKVALFEDIVAGAAAVHAAGRPHLGLCTANVVASWFGAAGAPARWQLHAALVDLGSALPVPMPGSGAIEAAPLLEPGPELREDPRWRPFLAPLLAARDATTVTMPVTCRSTAGSGQNVALVIEGNGPGAPRSFRGGDVVFVQPAAGGAMLAARVEEVRPRGLLATASLPPDDPCLQWESAPFEARLSFHRRLGPAADYFGLGVLLLHTLLVNDAQGIDEVVQAAHKVLRRFDDEPTGVRINERAAAVRLQQLLAARDVRPVFDPANLLHRRADRHAHAAAVAAGAPPVDGAIWHRLVILACKLLGSSASLAYVHGPADATETAMQQLRADLTGVQRALQVELFGAAERDRALETVCAEFAEELQTKPASPAATGRPRRTVTGFRLVVHREGAADKAAGAEDVRFEVDRVTIGRREGENVLRLNDPMVSSMHATIEWSPEGWIVYDRNSTNGTEVDGIRLPVEVPQPLQDGSSIHIRPFRLTFHELAPATDRTLAAPTLTADELRQQLRLAWATHLPSPLPARLEALRFVLRSVRDVLAPADLLHQLREVRAGLQGVSAADQPDDAQRAIDAMAARAMAQLSRSLLGPGEFASPDTVRTFAGKLSRFVETTTQWIERLLELRKVLGKHLEIGVASTASGRPSVRTAADVRELVLGWKTDSPAVEPSAFFLARFYDDLLAIVEGLIAGNQQVRRAVRERLDPGRLVELAGREAKVRLLVQAAAGSVLWKAYVQAFHEVTGGQAHEAEVQELLQKAMQERSERA